MRVRLSTTVDEDVLRSARELNPGGTDASMVELALKALLATHRDAVIDAAYAVYEEIPPDTPDDWGSPTEFSAQAARAANR